MRTTLIAMILTVIMPLMLLHAVQVGVLEVPDELNPEVETDLDIEGCAGCFIPVPNSDGVFLIAPLKGVDCKGRKPEDVVASQLRRKKVVELDLGGETWRGAEIPTEDGTVLYTGFICRDGMVWAVHFNFRRSKDFNADFRALVRKISFVADGKKEAVGGGGDVLKRFYDLDNAEQAFKKYKPRPLSEFGPVKPPAPAIDLSGITEANYKAAATEVKAAMRELAGMLTPEGEAEFEEKWSAVADYPDPKVLDYLRAVAPLANQILDLRTMMVTAIQAYDTAAGEAVTARSFGDYEAANELMGEAGKQAATMRSIEKAMNEALKSLEELGDPPDPSALKEEAAKSYRSARKTVAELFGGGKMPNLDIDGEYTYTPYMVKSELDGKKTIINVLADKDYIEKNDARPGINDHRFTRPSVYFKVIARIDQNHLIVYRADIDAADQEPSWAAAETIAQIEADGTWAFYKDGLLRERFTPQADGTLRYEALINSFGGRSDSIQKMANYADELYPAAAAGKAKADKDMRFEAEVRILEPTSTHHRDIFIPEGAITFTGKTLKEKQEFYREYGSTVLVEEFQNAYNAFACFANQLPLPPIAAAHEIYWVYKGFEPPKDGAYGGLLVDSLPPNHPYKRMAEDRKLLGMPAVRSDPVVAKAGNGVCAAKVRLQVMAGAEVLDSMTVERTFTWAEPPSVVPALGSFEFTTQGKQDIRGGLDTLHKVLRPESIFAGTSEYGARFKRFYFFGDSTAGSQQKALFTFRDHYEDELSFMCGLDDLSGGPGTVAYRYQRMIMDESEAAATANNLDAERRVAAATEDREIISSVAAAHEKSTAAIDAAAEERKAKARNEEQAFHQANISYLRKREQELNAEIAKAKGAGDQNRVAALEFQRIHVQSDMIYEEDRINEQKTGAFVASRTPFDDMCQLQMRENTEKMIRNAYMLKRQQQYVDFYLKELDGPQRENVYSIIDKINREDPLNPERWAQLNNALDLGRYGRQLAEEAKNDEEIAWAEYKLNAATNIKAGADTGMAVCSIFGGPQAIALTYQFATGTAEEGLAEGAKRAVTMYSDAVDIAWSTYDGYQEGGWKGALKAGGLSLFLNKGVPYLCEKLSTRGVAGAGDSAESAIKDAAKNADADTSSLRKMGKPPTGDDVATYMKEMDDAEKQVKEFISDSLAYKKAVKAKAPQVEIDALERKLIVSTARINENPTAKGYLKYKAPKVVGAQYDQALGSIHDRARIKYYENMRAKGFDDHQIRDFRNASSAGTAGMDYDQGLVETKIVTRRADGTYSVRYELPKRNGKHVSRQEWMDNAQAAWEQAYAEATGGFSAKKSWENMTTSAHPEAYRQLSVLSMRKDLSNVDEVMRKMDPDWVRQTADVTMFKAGEMLNDPSLSRLAGVREACRGTGKDMKTKFLPMLDKRIDELSKIPAGKMSASDRSNLKRLTAARERFTVVEQVFTEVGEASIPPTQWDDKIRIATGGSGIMETIQDMGDIFVSLFPK